MYFFISSVLLGLLSGVFDYLQLTVQVFGSRFTVMWIPAQQDPVLWWQWTFPHLLLDCS